MSTVTVIVLDVPGLALILERNGYRAVDGEHAITTANEIKESGGRYIVIANAVSPVSRAWLSRQASQRIPVLLTGGDPIKGTKSVELPATFNEIMAFFSAPPSPSGDVLVGVPLDEDEPDDDIFSVFSDDDEPTLAQEVTETPSPTPAPSVFEAPAPTPSVFEAPAPSPSVFEAPAPTSAPAPAPTPSVFEAPAPTPAPTSTPTPAPSVFEAPAPVAPPTPPPNRFPVPPTATRIAPAVEPEPEFIKVRPVPSRATTRRSNVIVVFGAKGGIGKSSTVIALAERAATMVVRPKEQPFKVIAIDANRGQGDMRTYLHLRNVPSIYDAAKSGRATASILTPTKLNGYRVGKPDIHFGVVLAPTQDQADPTVVTSSVYAEVIDEARSLADLVIIDTQIKEHFDTTGLFNDVIVPLLRSGAWGLGLTNSTTASYDNLKRALTKFQSDQVSRDRIMFAINNADPQGGIDPDQVETLLSPLANWVGIAVSEPAVAASANIGEIPGVDGNAPEFTAVLDNVLGRVLGGLEAFRPKVSKKAQEVGQRDRRRRWGRR
jgi:Mrp family chromosome partitioning ATPase